MGWRRKAKSRGTVSQWLRVGGIRAPSLSTLRGMRFHQRTSNSTSKRPHRVQSRSIGGDGWVAVVGGLLGPFLGSICHHRLGPTPTLISDPKPRIPQSQAPRPATTGECNFANLYNVSRNVVMHFLARRQITNEEWRSLSIRFESSRTVDPLMDLGVVYCRYPCTP